MADERPLVYFICTGNSARSQMAEGFARALLGGRFRVASGGLEPSVVNPLAVQAMREVGIDISDQRSKPLQDDLLFDATVIVTLCGDAEERCPVTPPDIRREHWPLPDPARAEGSERERLAVFRRVRDEIQERVGLLVDELLGEAKT
jgi:arsenate reductase